MFFPLAIERTRFPAEVVVGQHLAPPLDVPVAARPGTDGPVCPISSFRLLLGRSLEKPTSLVSPLCPP